MPGFVKTQRDEEIWEQAKARCREQGYSPEKDADKFYACANAEFHRAKRK